MVSNRLCYKISLNWTFFKLYAYTQTGAQTQNVSIRMNCLGMYHYYLLFHGGNWGLCKHILGSKEFFPRMLKTWQRNFGTAEESARTDWRPEERPARAYQPPAPASLPSGGSRYLQGTASQQSARFPAGPQETPARSSWPPQPQRSIATPLPNCGGSARPGSRS